MQNSKVKIQKYLFILLLGMGILWFASSAEAVTFTATGNPLDTPSGEVITAFSTNETLNYTDINGNPKPEVQPPSNIDVTVLPVYGFSTADLPDMTLIAGQTVTNEMWVTNEGNASDQYTISFYCDFTNKGTGADWTVLIKKTGGDTVATLTPGSPAGSTTETVAEDADYGFYHEVTGPTAGATYDAFVVIFSTSETGSTPYGEYTGANGLTYGGINNFTSITTYELDAPMFVMTRSSVVDAPKPPFGGGTHEAVPGSIITYSILYSNAGDATAESIVLVDKVPTGEGYATHLAHFNYGGDYGDTDHVNITAGRPQNFVDYSPGDGKWTIWYSTLDAPDKTYGNTADWTLIGTLESDDAPWTRFPGGTATYSLAAPASPEASAKWVKWENSNIAPTITNGTPTLTWGVTIR